MGGDSLDDLRNWNDPTGFLCAADKIGVMRRPGEFIDLQRLEEAIPGITRKVEFLNAPFVEISSSHIRRRAAEGGTFRYYLTAPVYELILQLGLYKSQEEF
jgi:nicotinate-nucleotide adenylyltransferase